ncbi:MAG: hypothetical protein B7Z15_08005 [Rhizobiales bacterium 32-66-8]|nr:MAG: hypothetical protein B7Z15_08005 [Rhizobiales bacterium 32-66-8]
MLPPPPHRTAPRPPGLLAHQYRTLGLTALGGSLELFDFVVFVFFVPVLATVFFPPDIPHWLAQLQTFVVFAVGFFARPFGGVLIAHFGDRTGRKRTFTFTVSLIAVATFGIASLPTYGQIGVAAPLLLALLRLLQGAAVGGEVAGGYLFGAEHVPDSHRGTACGLVAAGMTCGVLAGVMVAAVIHHTLSDAEIRAWGWRVPFLLGGGFGLLTLYMRRHLHETPVFRALEERQALAVSLPLGEVLRAHPRAILISVLTFWTFIAHFVVLGLMGPTLLQSLFQIPAAQALSIGSLGTAANILGCLLSGRLFDRLGEARALVLACLLALGGDLLFFMGAPLAPDATVPLFILATFGGGLLGAASVIMIRSFPPRIAYSGVSLSLNLVSGIIAGLTPIGLTAALHVLPSAPAWYLAAICLMGAGTGLWLRRAEVSGT